MTRLIDRLLSRAGYSEAMYSGAYYVAATDPAGRGKEGPAAGLARTAREAYATSGVVFACLATQMALLSEARFKFQSAADGHLFGTTDLALLEYPWPGATDGELLARAWQDVTTAGNFYLRKATPAGGGGDQLVQMRPDTVTIVSEEITDDGGRVFKRPVGYLEDPEPGSGREPQAFTTDEVAHFSPYPDPDASFRGTSWLTPVLREVRGDSALTEYRTVHLQRGALPGLVVRYPQRLSQTAINRLKTRFDTLFGGPANTGKTLVLDEGADVTVAGSTLEQLQFQAVAAVGERRICADAGPGLWEILFSETAGYEAAIRKLADLWARPMWRQICASLQHLIPTAADAGPVRLWYDVSGIAALREGELARSQATLVRAQAVSAFVAAGYTRESAVAAAETGDLTQLKADPDAGQGVAGRPPQAARPEALPGVVQPNLPNALPWTAPPMPAVPNGSARGPVPGRG